MRRLGGLNEFPGRDVARNRGGPDQLSVERASSPSEAISHGLKGGAEPAADADAELVGHVVGFAPLARIGAIALNIENLSLSVHGHIVLRCVQPSLLLSLLEQQRTS